MGLFNRRSLSNEHSKQSRFLLTCLLSLMLIDVLTQDDWVVNKWKICFSLHDKLQVMIDRNASVRNWYEDELIKEDWLKRLSICMITIRRYYTEFGVLPQVGDRLYDHDLGLLIYERSIDGGLGEITFILTK